MAGMVQSLNVAASAAVILAEVARQMVFRFPMRKILSCKMVLNVLTADDFRVFARPFDIQ